MPTKRADGRYYTRIYLGRDDSGRPKYKNVYASTLAEVRAKEAEVRHQLGKGMDLLSQRDSFAAWADGWLQIKLASRITDKQKENYRHSVKLWKGFLPGYEIGDVRAEDIERGLLSLINEGYAQRTIDFHRGTIRQIMRRATGRVISVNPESLVEIDVSGREPEQRRALTEEEQRWIWDTPGRGQKVGVIMMLSGLRRGELAALTWDDVDTKERTINVNKTIEYMADRTAVLHPYAKTDAGTRIIDIPKRLAEYLDGLEHDGDLVIQKETGGYMTESAWVKLWSSYMRELNLKYGAGKEKERPEGTPGPKVYEMTIPKITLHWLRHTFCTIMYLAGVDVKTASRQMGHADVATTLRIYTHLDDVYKRKSVGKMDRYLKDRF